MCIFSPGDPGWLDWLTRRGRGSTTVAETRIFARLEGNTQWLAYQMSVETPRDVAMILPVPVPPGSAEDALSFIDLAEYEAFFDHLAGLFPVPLSLGLEERSLSASLSRAPKLVVHSVGSFEASFVPTRADFSRLDRRFRLPDAVWSAIPRYADWGFAVFKLKKGTIKRIHPMAFRFPTREPTRIFFPTVHVHDGELHPTATFDHELYLQPPIPVPGDRGSLSAGPASDGIDAARARGLVDVDARVSRRIIQGTHDNNDIWVDLGSRAA